MARASLSEGWSPTTDASRDGTPIILWMIQDEAPPGFPEPVGFWIANPEKGLGYWRLFGEPLRFCSDAQIRGWKPLLRD
jgi:hypothetical protein